MNRMIHMIQRAQDSLFYLPRPIAYARHRPLASQSIRLSSTLTPAEDASEELCEPMILAEEVGVARL